MHKILQFEIYFFKLYTKSEILVGQPICVVELSLKLTQLVLIQCAVQFCLIGIPTIYSLEQLLPVSI